MTAADRKVSAMNVWALLPIVCLAAVPAFAAPEDDAMAHSKAFERAVNARDAKAILLSTLLTLTSFGRAKAKKRTAERKLRS